MSLHKGSNPESSLYAETKEDEINMKSNNLSVPPLSGPNNVNIINVNSAESSESVEVTPHEMSYGYYNEETVISRSNLSTDANTHPNTPDPGTGTSISLAELKYGASSFHAIILPVTLTMILSALAVTYIQTPETKAATEASVNGFYNVFTVSEDNSTAANIGLGLVNALVIVSAIAVATFLIVILYKFRCMKLLLGYMILSSAALLGLLGGLMFQVFLEKYEIPIDTITFYFLIVNFAAVGTISIFYQRGIPLYITQGYLIATSVILAWQLSHFNDWTAWCLLILLALYDLCAVLTPCGPLKALIKLMQKDNAPSMPGLLYEAQLPSGVERPSLQNSNNSNSHSNTSNGNNDNHNERAKHDRNQSRGRATKNNGDGNESTAFVTMDVQERFPISAPTIENQTHFQDEDPLIKETSTSTKKCSNTSNQRSRLLLNEEQERQTRQESRSSDIHRQAENTTNGSSNRQPPYITGTIPLAIADIYKLPIESPPQFARLSRSNSDNESGANSNSRRKYTQSELKTDVVVRFPRRGGRIILDNSGRSPKYIVYDKHMRRKRILDVDKKGKVFEESEEGGDGEEGNGFEMSSNAIKLGLGDFIFYSVLTSKAVQYSFTTFAACLLVILAGLGGTLIILSVYGSALPALPISIFLGVIFYFVTRTLIEPYWVEAVLTVPVYV